jgi:hypothetical protein
VALTYNGLGQWWSYTPETIYPADRPMLPTGHWEYPYYDPFTDTWTPVIDPTTGEAVRIYDPNTDTWSYGPLFIQTPEEANNVAINTYNQQLNDQELALNKINQTKNDFYYTVGNIVNATSQGSYNYLDAKQVITNQKQTLMNGGLSETEANNLIDSYTGPTGQYRNYYYLERVTPWDPSVLPANLSSTVKSRTDLGQQFNKYQNGNSGYYVNETPQGQAAKAAWDAAVASDNLDITARYGSLEAYAKQDYLNQITDPTKSTADIAAIRGSQTAPLSPITTDYREQVFPDAQGQQLRDEVQNKIFGLEKITTPGQTGYQFKDVNQGLSDLISSDPAFNKVWTDAKTEIQLAQLNGAATPGPWANLIKNLGVDQSMITDQNSFGSLLGRIATLNVNDPADKTIIDSNSQLVNTVSNLKTNQTFKDLISYTPQINDAFNASVQQSEADQTRKFGQLRQGILQDTINELKLAKQKELNLSFFKSSSVGQEITALQQDITGSMLGDLGVGGINPFGQSQQAVKQKLDLGLGDIFGTQNGLIYNWQDWFNNQIEKKYAGGIDIPNDYVPPTLRTQANGFVDNTTLTSWKKYDDAYATLKLNPSDPFAKTVIAGVPSDYVPVENRKTVTQNWLDYEAQLKAAGYVDQTTAANWVKYDQAYQALQKDPTDQAAQATWDSRPTDYILPDQRMNKDVQFAKDFFSTYLKPRFDASQSISEFQDYIDVTKQTQNPFQTQDRLDALKLAAQTSVSQWFTNLQKAGDSKFNADYYFDPVGYLKQNGVGDPNNPLLPGAAFSGTGDQANWYADTAAGISAAQQSAKVNADWEAAKQGQSTTDDYGNTINWLQQAYNYGVDVNNKAAFAQLHYQLVGMNAPQKDANGAIVTNQDGTVAQKPYDPAPDVYAPEIAQTYIKQILTPFLIDQSNKIGSVFGKFTKPADYVDEILKAVNLPQNKDQWNTILTNYGIDPKSSLTEIKTVLTDALSQDSTTNIKKRIGDLITAGKTPTQSELGVEYIQKTTPASGTVTPPSGIYAVFKNAGFNGSESDFYSTFLPDASTQDISILNASYTSSGQTPQLLPTITGGGMEQIATMAQLFGDTSIQEVLGTAGIAMPSGKPSLLGGLLAPSEGDVGIGDPFADTSTPFATVSGTSKSSDKIGIGNPFDVVGITDPFAEDSDPFASSNPFSSIGSTSSVSKPTINTNANVFTQGFSSSKNSSVGSLFDSFGGSFGF